MSTKEVPAVYSSLNLEVGTFVWHSGVMDQDNLEREGEESLTEALEGLETAQNTVEALQEFVRKNGEDEEKTQEGEETV